MLSGDGRDCLLKERMNPPRHKQLIDLMSTQDATHSSETKAPTTDDLASLMAKPQEEHEWLQQFVGDWTFESACVGEPGKPAEKFKGSESVKSLGGLWIVGDGKGEMPDGGTGHMQLTLGYDPGRRRYVGTWVGSMMTHLWIYDGALDESGRILTLSAEGPSFSGGGMMSKYQDIHAIIDEGHRTLTSRVQGEDGQWTQFMEAHYHRV